MVMVSCSARLRSLAHGLRSLHAGRLDRSWVRRWLGAQLVGMSATISNLVEIAAWLRTPCYSSVADRPRALHAYVVIGCDVYNDQLDKVSDVPYSCEPVSESERALQQVCVPVAMGVSGGISFVHMTATRCGRCLEALARRCISPVVPPRVPVSRRGRLRCMSCVKRAW